MMEANRTYTNEELLARIAELEKANATKRSAHVSFKVSDKGAVSVYGLGRFPVTLYGSQWEALLGKVDDLRAFITANAARLTTK